MGEVGGWTQAPTAPQLLMLEDSHPRNAMIATGNIREFSHRSIDYGCPVSANAFRSCASSSCGGAS